MRRHFGPISIALFALIAIAAASHGAEFRVGASSAAVNPPDGTFLAGYGMNRSSVGVHDDLYAKAVAFDDGTSRVVLLVVDSIGIQYDTVCAIREAAVKLVDGLKPEQVIVQSTHTHCGPDVIGIWGKDWTKTGRNPEYMAKLTETAAAQVAASIKNLQPATVVYAETECKGWAVNDSEPEVVDNSVTILQCLGKDGKSIATLTNFPCHPTVIDDETEPALISADWVGAFYKAMSASLPGEHLFLQGAVGCWMQPETPERTFVLAEKYGNDLAGKTLAALKTPKPLNDTALRSARKVFDFPLAADTPYRSFALAGLIPRPFGDTVQTEVAWFAIGPAQFATHPGETAPMYATQTRALMETGPKFILGLGLDELGYICPPDYFDHPEKYGAADYLIKMSPGKESGSALMSALETVIP